MIEKYEITAKCLNDNDFIWRYDTLEQAQQVYKRYSKYNDCYYLKLAKVIELRLKEKDESDKLILVSYLDGIEYCEEEFLDMDEAISFAEYVASFCKQKDIHIGGGK